MEPDFYPVPRRMYHADGTARFAFVTLLMLNDSYLPGVLMLAHGLRKQRTRADLVCLVSGDITRSARSVLNRLFDRVIEVEKTFIPYGRTQKRQHTPFVMTRLHALRLGADGDLGCRYEKIALLDADLLPLKNYDHLFTLNTPAGVINEHKTHLLQYNRRGAYVFPPDLLRTGKWTWHRHYEPICPHGCPIPGRITNRVAHNPANMGIHGAVFVLTPAHREFLAIQDDLHRPRTCRHIGESYPWPDMQYLTLRWSGRWTCVDLRFCGFRGYPRLSVLFGTHYAGIKPWQIHTSRTARRYARFEDFKYWFRTFSGLTSIHHPELLAHSRLKKLAQHIRDMQAVPAG